MWLQLYGEFGMNPRASQAAFRLRGSAALQSCPCDRSNDNDLSDAAVTSSSVGKQFAKWNSAEKVDSGSVLTKG